MPTLSANGIQTYYEIHGRGRTLVLISGMAYGLWEWHRMLPGLADHFQVIVYDNRGAGQTDKPPGPYTAAMMAADLAGLLDGLEIKETAVLGHSLGGFIAQQLLLDRPDLVSHLILAGTHFGGPNHIPVTPEALAILMDTTSDPLTRLKRGVAIAAAPGFAETQPDIYQNIIDYRLTAPVPPEAYQAQLGVGLGLATAEAAFEGKLRQANVPALILFGEHDNVVPVGNVPLLANEFFNPQTVILPNAGHIFPLEAPAAANEAVIEFLTS